MTQKMLDNKAKRELKTNQRRVLIDSIEIGIPSPQHIYTWGERRLPNGERVGQIKNSKTVSYKRLTPLRDGLFCERIFGPVNSFVCACGKAQPRADITFCEKCQVEYTDQRTRRYRLGYISLLSPVAHIWYLKGRPSYISLFLGQRKKKIVALAYCNAYLVEQGVCERSCPNLALAPAGVTAYNQEREAHGINKYTQNINSFTSTRQISNLFDNSTATLSDPDRFDHSFQYRQKDTTENSANGATHENVENISSDLSLMQSSTSRLRNSLFHRFQEQINKKASPASFSHLLTEVLGDVEKNIVLIDSLKADLAQVGQKSANSPSCSLDKALIQNREANRTANMFSLRPLWGSTCFEQEAQSCQSLRSLLSIEKTSAKSTCVETDTSRALLLLQHLRYAQECNRLSRQISFQKASIDLIPRISVSAASVLPLRCFANSQRVCSEYQKLNTLMCALGIDPTRHTLVDFSTKDLISSADGCTDSMAEKQGVRSTRGQTPVTRYPSRARVEVGATVNSATSPIGTFRSTAEKICSVGRRSKGREPMPYLNHCLRIAFKQARAVALVEGATRVDRASISSQVPPVPSTRYRAAALSFSSDESALNNSSYSYITKREVGFGNKQPVNQQSHLSLPVHETVFREIAQTPQKGLKPYNRAHTLPFLPHLVCQYNLRDQLLNFLDSSPLPEDIPLPMYCELPRRSPLRDVNQFLPEESFSQSDASLFDNSTVSHNPSLPFLKQKTDKSVDAATQKGVQGSRFYTARSSLSPEVGLLARKHFVNLKARGVAQNLPHLLSNDLSFGPEMQTANTLSGQKKFIALKDAQVDKLQRERESTQFNSNSTRRAQHNQEHTHLEQLASLRNILYMALLQKSLALSLNGLDARINKMSAVLTKLSRENLIYESTRLAALHTSSLNLSNPNSAVSGDTATSSSQSVKAHFNRSASLLNSKTQGETKRSLRFNSKWSHFNPLDSASQQPFLNKNDLLTKIKHFDLQTQIGSKGFKEMSSLLRITNALHFQSPEKLYRSLVLDKRWLSAFLLEKHVLDKEGGVLKLNHFNLKAPQSLYTSQRRIAGQQGELAFGKQARLAPSIVHALRQHANNRTGASPYLFTTQKTWCADAKSSTLRKQRLFEKRIELLQHNFEPRNATVSNKRARANVVLHEKRLLHRVYTPTFVITLNEAFERMYSAFQFLPPSQFLAKDAAFLRKAIQSASIPSQLEAKGLQSFLHNSNQKERNSSLFEGSHPPLLDRRAHDAVDNSYSFGQERITHLSGIRKGENPALFGSSLSFFLLAPESQKAKQKQNKLAVLSREQKEQRTLRKAFLEQKGEESGQMSNNGTSVQIQGIDGNSRLFDTPKSLFYTPYHHIEADARYEQAVQASTIVTRELSKGEGLLEGAEASAQAALLKPNPAYSSESTPPSSRRSRAALSHPQPLYPEKSPHETQEMTQGGVQQESQRAAVGESIPFEEQADQLSPFELVTIREILSYTGGGALHKLLQRFDTQLFSRLLFTDVQNARKSYKKRVINKFYSATRLEKRVLTRLRRRIYKNSRRLKIAQLLTRCKRRPEWMMISVLPVLPPDLRPILKMSEGAVVVSDLNNLYQRVVYRNNRFQRLAFIDFHFVTPIQRLVQDAVDRLIENGKGGSKPLSTPAGRPLKSLSDTLKGKKGRFRLNLLGKRVDFSGRSVIVVSPNLQIHECGIPRQIALELYNYFLIRLFVLKKQVSNVVMGKKMIKQKDSSVWDALRTLIYHHPVLLNRAPTLHRLGIQAFQPKLVRGNAICLNPLVCSGFNADFDGDQMGVHLPLSTQARAEAWDLLWSRNNLLSPATGQAVLVPSQDMVLGLYYMTQSFSSRAVSLADKQLVSSKDQSVDINLSAETESTPHIDGDKHLFSPVSRTLAQANRVFFDSNQLVQAFQNRHILLHTPVWLQWKGKIENDEGSYAPIELRINTFSSSTHIYSRYKRRNEESTSQSQLYVRTTAGRVLVNSIVFP